MRLVRKTPHVLKTSPHRQKIEAVDRAEMMLQFEAQPSSFRAANIQVVQIQNFVDKSETILLRDGVEKILSVDRYVNHHKILKVTELGYVKQTPISVYDDNQLAIFF